MVKFNFGQKSRLDLLKKLARHISAKSYLEIGCYKDEIFSKIKIKDRIGVDPVQGGNTRMTSNEFFETNDKTFDLIFIDGLHHYDQVKKDFENSLNVLNKNGFIVIHDMLPENENSAKVPRIQKEWLGDVWKLGFDLIQREDINFHIIEIDHGCGVVELKNQKTQIVDNTIWDWEFYENNYQKLPIISYNKFERLLKCQK